ncbi:ethylbenzene dehydrogenase-related protein [bacterium]|nr:ethylbenzene dehydrogenase-related protein [bacterium]
MKPIITLCLLSALTAAGAAPVQAAPATIDNTPVAALPIGGSMQLLRAKANLDDPESVAWRDAQEYSMELGMAPPVHPSVNLRYDATTPAVKVFLRAATDGNKLYLRLRWADESQNTANSRTDFADGAAVQFALGDAASTSFMMGAANGPVNIWYWKAGQTTAQNLAAGGFGSTTQLDGAGLASSDVYRSAGEWVVVFSRPLEVQGEHQVTLDKGQANMAFALWQGEQKQRDGLKHVSMGWVSLSPVEVKTAAVEQAAVEQAAVEQAAVEQAAVEPAS